MKVLVLGGCGFIGLHTVRALLARGHEVIVGTRNPWRQARYADHAVILREAKLQHLTQPSNWSTVLAGVDVVINCVGILRERPGESYEAIHHHAPKALAQACLEMGISRLIHISALGLADTLTSGFCRSKLNGELALLAMKGTKLKITIVRPSLLDGEDGFGARWLRRVARWPVLLAPASPNGKIAPFHVEDLGQAIANLVADKSVYVPECVELGGPILADIGAYMQALRVAAGLQPATILRVPVLCVRWVSHICDALHFSPLSFGHVELMRRDNVPAVNHLSRWLGRAPRSVGAAIAPHLAVRPIS